MVVEAIVVFVMNVKVFVSLWDGFEMYNMDSNCHIIVVIFKLLMNLTNPLVPYPSSI